MAAWPMVVDFLIVLSFICTLQAFRDYRRRRGLPYPPGPRPLPIIGNLLDIPMESSWLAYSQLAKKYGTSYVLFTCPAAMLSVSRGCHVISRSRARRRHIGLYRGYQKFVGKTWECLL
jgi:hypothetical protein